MIIIIDNNKKNTSQNKEEMQTISWDDNINDDQKGSN